VEGRKASLHLFPVYGPALRPENGAETLWLNSAAWKLGCILIPTVKSAGTSNSTKRWTMSENPNLPPAATAQQVPPPVLPTPQMRRVTQCVNCKTCSWVPWVRWTMLAVRIVGSVYSLGISEAVIRGRRHRCQRCSHGASAHYVPA